MLYPLSYEGRVRHISASGRWRRTRNGAEAGTKEGIGSGIQVPATTPLDPKQRRDEWRLAVTIVALVASGMTGGAGDASGRRTQGRDGRSDTPAGERGRGGAGGRRLVRPPRSC